MCRLFFFKVVPGTEVYTLSLHDALPISLAYLACGPGSLQGSTALGIGPRFADAFFLDRKSTRLNSSHVKISYAVFCLKKKTMDQDRQHVLLLAIHTQATRDQDPLYHHDV